VITVSGRGDKDMDTYVKYYKAPKSPKRGFKKSSRSEMLKPDLQNE